MNLTPRLILLCCGLLAFASATVFGAGEYQPARDGKTRIWNWSPKAGETGSWSGDRDKDNYASGFGDLAWYNADGKVFGLFYGNMVHGKFEGAVNVHTGDRVAHAYFVNGERVTAWARGAAKSTMTASEAAIIEKRKAQAKKENVQQAEALTTPAAKKETEKIAEAAPPPAGRSVRGLDSYHKEALEKSGKVAEKKNKAASAEEELRRDRPLSADEELKRTEPAPRTTPLKTFVEPTPLPKVAASEKIVPEEKTERPEPEKNSPPAIERSITESPPPATELTPPILHEPPTKSMPEISDQKPEATEKSSAPEPSQPSTLNPQPSSTPADVSVNALVGPPASLRTNAMPESPPLQKSEREPESAPKSEAPLSESEAVDLANTEARAQDAPLDSYDRPKVDHSAVKGKWTLFYSRKSEASTNLPATFSATVDDKTKKVEIRK